MDLLGIKVSSSMCSMVGSSLLIFIMYPGYLSTNPCAILLHLETFSAEKDGKGYSRKKPQRGIPENGNEHGPHTYILFNTVYLFISSKRNIGGNGINSNKNIRQMTRKVMTKRRQALPPPLHPPSFLQQQQPRSIISYPLHLAHDVI